MTPPATTMFNRIFKYSLRVGLNNLQFRADARALHVGSQPDGIGHTLQLWAFQGNAAGCKRVGVLVVGTGHDFDASEYPHYLGTLQAGYFVWHAFTDDAAFANSAPRSGGREP